MGTWLWYFGITIVFVAYFVILARNKRLTKVNLVLFFISYLIMIFAQVIASHF
ncbi:hypothetical protein LBR03_22870 [Levilactobacillus brevis]|nr:hypothetical protein LBR03_22870 [Levilactobacillus brevis]